MSQAEAVHSTERPCTPTSDPAEAYAERRRLRELRTALEATLDEMVSLLDTLDGDTDAEPTLGAGGTPADLDDAEEENEHGSDDDEGEPCLGAAEGRNQAATWRVGGHEDGEASLGSLGGTAASGWMPQTTWAFGARDDREDENEHGGDINDEPHDATALACWYVPDPRRPHGADVTPGRRAG